MRSRLSLLCAVGIVSVANFLTIASDIPNQTEVVDLHDNKSVGRTLVTVDDEMRMPVNALVTRLNEISRENVVENLETVVESFATSFAQNSEINLRKIFENKEAVETKIDKMRNDWLVEGIHPDKIYTDNTNFDMLTFFAWINYIITYVLTNGDELISPILSLHRYLSHHSNDVIIAIATKPYESKNPEFYNQLLTYLMCYWFNSFKTPDQVNTLLETFENKHYHVSFMKDKYKEYYGTMSSHDDIGKFKTSNTLTPPTTRKKGKNRHKDKNYGYKEFVALASYVHTYNKANPATPVGLLPVLIASFGESVAASVISAAKTVSDTADEAINLEINQIEHWVAMKDPVEVLKLIDSGDQSSWSISTLIKYFDKFCEKKERPPFNLMATLTKYATEEQLVEIVMEKQAYVDVERLKTLLFLDWFNSLKSDEDVKNLLLRSKLDINRVDSCLKSFQEFRTNTVKHIKSTLSENVSMPAGNTIDHDSNHDSLMLSAYETFLVNYNKKNPNMQLRLPAILRAVSDKSELAAISQSAKLSSSYASDTQLERDQIQSLIRSGKPLGEIIGSLGSNLQPRPFLDKCIEIADEFVKYGPKLKYDPIEIFKKHYDNSVLASIVEEEMLKHPHSSSRVEDVYFHNLFSRMISPDRLSNLLSQGTGKKTNFDFLVENYRQFVDSMGPPDLLEDIRKWCKTKKTLISVAGQPIGGTKDTAFERDRFLYDGKVFAAYESYIRAHNKAKPFLQIELLPALTIRFGDRDTSTMILAAKTHPKTAKVAELLEIEQIEHWIKAGKNPDQVFELMDFDFQSLSSINKWFCFVKKYFLSHELLSFNPILILKKRFSIGELVRIIAKEKDSNDVKELKELVIHDLFNSMQSDSNVLEQLSDGGRNDMIVNSLLKSLKQFSEKMKNLPDLTMLEDGRDFKLLTSDIIYQLKFKDRAHDGLLLNAYDIYVSAYNKQCPTKHLSLLAVLIATFGSREVLNMIYAAKSDLVVVETAKYLEVELVRQLVDSGKSLDELTELILHNQKSDLAVFTWVKCINEYMNRFPEEEFCPIQLVRQYVLDEKLAALVLAATPEYEKDAKQIQDMLMLDWFNEMLTTIQVKTALNIHDQLKKKMFLPIIQALVNYNKEVGSFSSSPQVLLMLEGWREKNKISQLECDLLKSEPTDEKLYGPVIKAYDTYIRLYNAENPTKKLSLLPLLTSRFKDEKLLAMIDKAHSYCPEIAEDLETKQTLFWVKRDKDPQSIVKLLEFPSKSLHYIYKWIDFSKISYKFSKPSFDPIELLKTHFSDLELATFLVDAMSSNSVDAIQLKNVLFLHWFNRVMTRQGLQKLLELDDKTKASFDSLLTNFDIFVEELKTGAAQVVPFTSAKKILNYGAVFSQYDDYVNSYNKDQTIKKLSLFALLSVLYGDKVVVEMTHEAKLSSATCASAELVENEQIQYWVDDRRSLADVVNLLDLGSKTPSPVFRLINFYERICKIHPESFFDPLDVLKKYYSDAMLAKLVVEATSTTVSGATQLKDILFLHWFNMAITRERLNELLEINNENMKHAFDPLLKSFDVFIAQLKEKTAILVFPIFSNKKLSHDEMLTEFEKQLCSYNTKNPFKQFNLLALLSVHFDSKFADELLNEAKLKPSTRDFVEFFETQQFQHWIDSNVPLNKAVKWLDSGSRNSRFFSRLIKLYQKYSDHHFDFLSKASKNYIPENELISFIGEATSVSLESAKQLRKMLFQNWFNRAMKPTDLKKSEAYKKSRFDSELEGYKKYYALVQTRLLQHVGDLKSKSLGAFANFIALIHDWNKSNPLEQVNVFAALTACFDEREASTMIEAAKLDPITKEIALLLETEQIKYWLDTDKTPRDVVKLLDFENERFVMLHKWEEFWAAYRARNPNSPIDPIELLNPYFDDFTLATYVMEEHDAKRLQDMLFQHWFDNGKSYDYLKVLYGDHESKSSIFEGVLKAYERFITTKSKAPRFFTQYIEPDKHVNFFEKLSQLNKNKPIHLLAQLTAIVRDESTISKILEAGRQNRKVQGSAILLQKLRSERWVKDKFSPTNSFILQKLDLLVGFQPELLTWVESVVEFNQAYPNDAESMYDIVIEYAPQLNMEEAFTMMTKDSRWKEVAVQIKCELNFCLKAEIAPDFFHKLISLDLKQPDILKSDDFKLLVKYAVNFYFLHPNIVGNQPVLTILKKAAQTDTETLIKRLEQATNIEAITPSNRLVDLLKNILAKEDKLKWAWFRYASTLDCQPLNWNTATMLSTIYSEEELDSAVVEVSSEVKDSPEFKVFLVALEDDSNDALQKCAK